VKEWNDEEKGLVVEKHPVYRRGARAAVRLVNEKLELAADHKSPKAGLYLRRSDDWSGPSLFAAIGFVLGGKGG